MRKQRILGNRYKPIRVILLPKIREIIKRWGVASLNPDDDAKVKDDKAKFLMRFVNKYMKRIGVELGFSDSLTSYVARHSFATVLKNSGAPAKFIKESLGHASLQTTQNYLDSFEDDTKIKYQNAILDLDDDIPNTNLGA